MLTISLTAYQTLLTDMVTALGPAIIAVVTAAFVIVGGLMLVRIGLGWLRRNAK